MLRLFYFGALLGVAAILSAPICAQMPAASGARVQHVVVRGTGAAMEVEIQTSGTPVEPDTQAITGPDRIVVDFPGALPAAELRALKVNRGALKAVRTGLFFDNPPITRVVLDLAEPQSYRVSTRQNAVVIKLGSATAGEQASDAAPTARLQNASLATGTPVATARVSAAVANAPLPAAFRETPPPPKPPLTVTFENGMLRIHAEKATLAQVLFEVQHQTQAEIAIPAGAEQEQVVADLGPAPARDVLGALLNGSAYNFIFVGDELSLQRVILTRRDTGSF
jgi:AMIN domain